MRILLCDDDSEDRLGFQEYYQRLHGIKVDAVETHVELLRKICEGRYDFVFIDPMNCPDECMLPQKIRDIFGVAQRIKDIQPSTRIYALTMHSSDVISKETFADTEIEGVLYKADIRGILQVLKGNENRKI